MKARILTLATLTSLVSVVGLLAFSCAPAGALVTHKLLKQITEVPATGPHGEPVAVPGPFGEVPAVAFDSGRLLVADRPAAEHHRKNRLDRFNASSGEFESQLLHAEGQNGEIARGEAGIFGVAVGHSTGEAVTYVGAGEAGEGGPSRGIVDVFGESGALLATWKGASTPSGSFGLGPVSVAVDNDPSSLNDWAAGDVFVATTDNANNREEENTVNIFKPEAGDKEPLTLAAAPVKGTCASPGTCPGSEIPFPSRISAVAVDEANGDLLIAARGRGAAGAVDVFKPVELLGVKTYEYVTQITQTPEGPFGNVLSVAVDGGAVDSGDIYVGTVGTEGFGEDVEEFRFAGPADESTEYVGRIPGTGAVAVDPASGDVYINGDQYSPDLVAPDVTVSEPVSNPTTTGVTLHGTVNPAGGGEATCEFEYGTTLSYGSRAPCTAAVAEGDTPVAVESARVTGLAPDTTYHYRLDATTLADGQTNTGEAVVDSGEFRTAGPTIESESVSDVASTSATIDATIDPNNANGAPTSYYFQYGSSASYEHEIPASPGEPIGPGGVGVEVNGAHVDGLVAGSTYHYRVVVLSEVMAEVTPGKFEERVETLDGPDQVFTTQKATGDFELPDGREWEMVSPADKHGALIEPLLYDEQAAVDGSAMTYTSVSPTEADPRGYTAFGQVLSTREPGGGWGSQDIESPHAEAVGLSGGEYSLFSENLSLGLIVPENSVFTALAEDASEQTPYVRSDFPSGDVGDHCTEGCYRPLVAGCPALGVACRQAVEENADVPAGTVFGGTFTSNELAGYEFLPPLFKGSSPDLSHVLLEDPGTVLKPGGGKVYVWSAGSPPSEQIEPVPACSTQRYYRGGEIRDVRELFGGSLFACEGEHNEANGEAAAEYPKQVFEWERPGEPITLGGAVEGFGGAMIVFFGGGQECEVKANGTDRLECAAVPGPNVSVVGKSRGGSYVYGFSSAVLTATANSRGEKAAAGASNLYMTHYNGAEWEEARFIHSGNFSQLGRTFEVRYPGDSGVVKVSPNGQWAVFRIGLEDYLYGAEDERVVCATCNPTGARTEGGPSDPGLEEAELEKRGYYEPRYLSNRGQLFFDTAEALVPKDVDGQLNVYEYEPEGVGGCQSSTSSGSVVFTAQADGCIGLISSGESSEPSYFLDASESGGDVFFFTQNRLVPQDTEGSYSVYDAHECTSAEPCPAPIVQPPPCSTGDSCKPAPTPQPSFYGAPASATFSGAGNLAPPLPAVKKVTKKTAKCKRGFVKNKQGKCVKKPKARKKTKKPTHHKGSK